MLWLGDNWYTREVDYTSPWGLWYRPHHDRSTPVLQDLLKSMSHLAIWDDHDYGPNDYAKSYFLKNESLDAFKAYWLNPSHGDGKEGIYTRYQYSDVDFFLLDDRWWRDDEGLPDSIGGKPNENKRMFGKKQLDWLKDELRISKRNPYVSFRIIATGNQVLNPASPFDKMLNFQVEYNELVSFLRDEKIDGVLFLTGDRHHSEIIKVQPAGLYPLYDITCSPLTSGTHKFGGKEATNPYRVLGVDQLQNYGRISVTGERNKRTLKVDFVGIKGESLGSWQVNETELRVGAGR
jgi:alkaline phosphatase D